MTKSDSFNLLVKKVAKGDSDRYLSLDFAKTEFHAPLLALYAFNLEVSAIPYRINEPEMGEFRLAWWQETIDSLYAGELPAGEPSPIVIELAKAIVKFKLEQQDFDNIIRARGFDIYKEPMLDRPSFDTYIEDTSSSMMRLAVKILFHDMQWPEAFLAVDDFGYAIGVANLLRAYPALHKSGRRPLPKAKTDKENIANVNQITSSALNRLYQARAAYGDVSHKARAAFMIAPHAEHILKRGLRPSVNMMEDFIKPAGFVDNLKSSWILARGRW